MRNSQPRHQRITEPAHSSKAYLCEPLANGFHREAQRALEDAKRAMVEDPNLSGTQLLDIPDDEFASHSSYHIDNCYEFGIDAMSSDQLTQLMASTLTTIGSTH